MMRSPETDVPNAKLTGRGSEVLEHPAGSKLWPAMGLPEPGKRDAFGGWTLPINQHWWGHRAEKKTKLYIVGCAPKRIPDMPMRLDYPTHVIGDVGRAGNGKRPEISKAEREHTPPELAAWLCQLAEMCVPNAKLTWPHRAAEQYCEILNDGLYCGERMRSHELAKQLLSMPNRDLFLSIDMSENEENANHRAFSDSVIEAIDNGVEANTITILAESGALNF